MVKRFKLTIFGKVQGVWYRASAQRKATEQGLSGFVKNVPDGSVYIEAEGSPEALSSFIRWCHQGPELARVERVESLEIPPTGQLGFEVSR